MLKVGTTLGPYEIISPLGAGGMGEVYRARDARLDRDVAIKVLPGHLSTNEEFKTRFEREAKAVAALSHPNILAIYDVGQQEGTSYVVTELLEGETLRQTLISGTVPRRKAIEIAIAVADGLAATHARGVVHRDLKPENIFLTTDGVVKILDFGLARVEAAGAQTQDAAHTPTVTLNTTPGTVMGTINYMSPEQVRALRADARSDVFSFGCVLYEMLTGQKAFVGETSADTITAILREPPKNIRSVRNDVGPELERVIDRCLEKKPESRFQSSQDLAFTLRSILADSGSASPREARKPVRRIGLLVGLVGVVIIVGGFFLVRHELRKDRYEKREAIDSIAVLPLENVSRDPDEEYFVDGMTEALISDLAKIGGLKVISRTSVMRYKATTKLLPEIAKELNVDAVVEGSVLRVGDRVRITAQLIHAATDEHLWADSYDRDLRDVLRLHSEVARTIAQQIKVTLTPQEQAQLTSARAVSPEAHEAYLKGLYHWNKFTEKGWYRAVDFFREALDVDPTYAPAYAGLAQAYAALGIFYLSPEEAYPKGKSAALKAVALDESLAQAHAELAAVVLFYERDWTTVERELQRALNLDPNASITHDLQSLYLAAMGRLDEAVAAAKRAQSLDPLSSLCTRNVGWAYFNLRDYEQAIDYCRKTLDLDPNFDWAHSLKGWALIQQGRYDEVLREYANISNVDERSPGMLPPLVHAYSALGRKADAERIVDQLLQRLKVRYVDPAEIALSYLGLGDRDRAFQWLETAVQQRSAWWPNYLNVSPVFDSLRSDPRFVDLVRRVGLPPLSPMPSTTPAPPPLPRGDRGGLPATDKHALAVLPFVNQSGNPDDEYFSDGMTDELASALMKVPGLRVAARSSAFTFKGKYVEAQEVGAKLNVAAVLEGTVRRSGSKLRVTAQLVNVADGLVRWSEKYEREAKDVFAVQDDITREIVSALQLTLGSASLAGNKAVHTDNLEVHDLYLRGRFLAFKLTEEGLWKGLEYFAKAIEKDPGYAPAYAGMAFAYMWLADGFAPPREANPKAKVAMLKALELDGTNAEAHTYLGMIHWFYDWEFETIDVEFRRALQLNPNSMEAHNFYGLALCGMRRFDEGLAETDRAIILDPLSPVPSWTREWCFVMSRRYDEAIAQNMKTTELDPAFFYLESLVALAYREKGMLSESVAEYQRLQRIIGGQPIYGLAITYARMGKTAEARDILNEFLELSIRKYVSPEQIALIYASLDEKDDAFAWLDRAYEARSGWMTVGILGSPDYDPLRSDPRFEDLLRRIGLTSFTPKSAKGSSAQPASQRIRLAVLPFANDSGDKELDYLSDGVAETLINGFSRLEGLSTVPRSTAFRHRDADIDPVQAGRQLSATAVLTGRVLKRGDNLTIQAELVDVTEGRQLWGERYQRKFTDFVEIERDIAGEITDALRLRLTGEEKRKLSRGYSENAEAYRLYLEARFWWNKRTKEGFDNALRLFGQAVQIDPTFALAHTGIADTYSLLPLQGFLAPQEALVKAQKAANKALQLDDQLAEAHCSIGMVRFYLEWDLKGGEIDFQRAMKLNPRYATAHQWYALNVGIQGRISEARTELLRAIELDPLAPIFFHNLGWVAYWERDWNGMLSRMRAGLEFAPEFPLLCQGAGLALLELGQTDEALAHMRKATGLAPSSSLAASTLGYGLARAGRQSESRALLAEWLELTKTRYVPPCDIAMMYLGLGELDLAVEWLEKGIEVRDTWMAFLGVLPQWEPLRGDPRFTDLLRRAGLPNLRAGHAPTELPTTKPTP